MATIDPPVLNIEINQKESPAADLIEIPPEILSKIENVEENNNNKFPKIINTCWKWIRIYAKKFCGLHEKRPNRLPWQEYIWSFIGALLGIAAVAFLHFRVLEQSVSIIFNINIFNILFRRQLSFMIGSFGASAVLIFGAPRSPLAQPRNLIGGHVISAICGCTVRVAIDRFEHSTACALAVASAIVTMQLTETVHPPGGATALLAVTTQPILPWENFLFILMPVLTGACTMLLVALIINNMAPKRTYPCFWW